MKTHSQYTRNAPAIRFSTTTASKMVHAASVGINLGSTYACVAADRNGRTELIANEQGSFFTPSVVAFSDVEPEGAVGETAVAQAHKNPTGTVRDVKFLLGRQFDDPAVQEAIAAGRFPFAIVAGEGGAAAVDFGPVTEGGASVVRTPRQLAALLLTYLYTAASSALGVFGEKKKGKKGADGADDAKGVTQTILAVVPVPADYSEAQAAALAGAVTDAGFAEVQLVRAPAAAALSQQARVVEELFSGASTSGTAIVHAIDFGGSALHSTTTRVSADGLIEVLATKSDAAAAGTAVDAALFGHFAALFEKKSGGSDCPAGTLAAALKEPKGTNPKIVRAAVRMLKECERAKSIFGSSGAPQVQCSIDGLLGDRDMAGTLSRPRVEGLVGPAIEAAIEAGKPPADVGAVDAVVLLGGGAPLARALPSLGGAIQRAFPRASIMLDYDDALAQGADCHGAAAHGAAMLAIAVLDHAEGIAEDESKSADADGAKLEPALEAPCAPHTISIASEDGVALALIGRGAALPATASRVVALNLAGAAAAGADGAIGVRLLEGERALVADNKLLGELRVPLPKEGETTLTLTARLGKDGSLVLRAAFGGDVPYDEDDEEDDGEEEEEEEEDDDEDDEEDEEVAAAKHVSAARAVASFTLSAAAGTPSAAATAAEQAADVGAAGAARAAVELLAYTRKAAIKATGTTAESTAFSASLTAATAWLTDTLKTGAQFTLPAGTAGSALSKQIREKEAELQAAQKAVTAAAVAAAMAAAKGAAPPAAPAGGDDDADSDMD